jgi:hypothetical protein
MRMVFPQDCSGFRFTRFDFEAEMARLNAA